MLTVEEIKKGCEFTEGFELLDFGLNSNYSEMRFTNYSYSKKYSLSSTEWVYDKYGDFLQRVIEGINKKHDDIKIIVEYNHYQGGYQFTHLIYETCNHKHSCIFDTIDQAKEQAIKYVLENICS